MGRQTERWTNTQMSRQTDRQIDGQTPLWADRWRDRQTLLRADRQADRQTDRQTKNGWQTIRWRTDVRQGKHQIWNRQWRPNSKRRRQNGTNQVSDKRKRTKNRVKQANNQPKLTLKYFSSCCWWLQQLVSFEKMILCCWRMVGKSSPGNTESSRSRSTTAYSNRKPHQVLVCFLIGSRRPLVLGYIRIFGPYNSYGWQSEKIFCSLRLSSTFQLRTKWQMGVEGGGCCEAM